MSAQRILSCYLSLLLAACAGTQFGSPQPVPGNGPGGKPMRTATEVAVGVPPAALNPPLYPLTAQVGVRENYHGRAIADPYRWLENLDSAETRAWVAAQNRLAEPRLAALPAREWLQGRLRTLWNYERYGVPLQRGGHYFYLHNSGQQNQSVLYVADTRDGADRVLLDPNAVRSDATVALSEFEPSPRGDLLAYALSDGGSDWQVWRFRRVRDGQDLPDELHFTKFWGVSWARDGAGVYYSRYPVRPDGRGDDAGRPAIYFHALGTPQAGDRLVYAVADHPTRVPAGRVSEDGRWLVVTLFDGYEKNGVELLDLTQPKAAPQRLFSAWDARYEFIGSSPERLYFQTTKDAPRGRVIAVDPQHPEQGFGELIAEDGEAALEGTSYVGKRLIARYVREAHALVRLFGPDGRPRGELALPGLGTVEGFTGEGADAETFFAYTDFLRPGEIWHLDAGSGQTTLWRRPRLPASTEAYVTEQVFYRSKDGTRVPMYITRRRDLPRDGDQPTLLYGYGGFNVSLTPDFSPEVLAWLEMGGVYAEANLRGGGEYGEAWHKAGTLEHKQNVFDDFIAGAEYLIAERYTRPQRLGIYGRSNGGLLVGAVLTQRPDLFGAAVPAVGVLDMLRYHTASANARQWSSDYGLPEDARQFESLYAYSPYHNVKKGSCYPPTLITTADHDDRVAPWHSYKFAAALQAAQACANPVLIRIETRAGHGAGKPLWMQIDDVADRWAFLAKWLGMKAPQSTDR